MAILCRRDTIRRLRHLRTDTTIFNQIKNRAIVGLSIGLLEWSVSFIPTLGERFLIRQSKSGTIKTQYSKYFTVINIIVMLVVFPDQKLDDWKKTP